MRDLHRDLNGEWDAFQRKLMDYDQTLQEQKEKFKNSLLLSSQDFRDKTQNCLKDFADTGAALPSPSFTPGPQTWGLSSASVLPQVLSTARWAVK